MTVLTKKLRLQEYKYLSNNNKGDIDGEISKIIDENNRKTRCKNR